MSVARSGVTLLDALVPPGRRRPPGARPARELGVIGRGRKAWLFVGSDAGGEWLAILYTVVRTCQRLSVAPFDYLAWVLPKLSSLPVNRGRGHVGILTPMAHAKQQLS